MLALRTPTHARRDLALLDALLDDAFFRPRTVRTTPQPRVAETDDGWTLTLEAPGVTPDDIDLKATADTLTLVVERRHEVPEGYTALRTERSGWRLSRTWSPPAPIDPDRVTARLVDGVLTLTLPRAEAVEPRRIDVQVA